MTLGVVLALLYLGRSVLIPLALAIMLSLLVALLVRALRRIRFGRTPSVLIAVVALIVSCTSITLVLGAQILHIAESLPHYESNVRGKLKTLEEVTVGPIFRLTKETTRFPRNAQSAETIPVATGDVEPSLPAALPSQDFESHHPLQLVWKLLIAAWHPIQCAGIVLLVLIFFTRARVPARPIHPHRRRH
jgi:predicted PurR-regulated permease PerM